jgi:hypothetical protein
MKERSQEVTQSVMTISNKAEVISSNFSLPFCTDISKKKNHERAMDKKN